MQNRRFQKSLLNYEIKVHEALIRHTNIDDPCKEESLTIFGRAASNGSVVGLGIRL